MTNRVHTVGVIGFGFAGKLHAEALQHLGIQPANIWVHDTDRNARSAAVSCGYTACDTFDMLLDRMPEACIIALPPASNKGVAERIVMRARKLCGILIEKPLAVALDDARFIQRAMADARLFSMVGLTGHGFHPEFAYAREIIRSGALGDIHTFIEEIRQGGHDFPRQYVSAAYGGAIYELGVHTLDHIRYLLNEPHISVESVRGGNDHMNCDAYDWCNASLSIPGRNIGLFANWEFVSGFPAELLGENYCTKIVGTKGCMRIYGFDRVEVVTNEGESCAHFHDDETSMRERHRPGFVREVRAFLEQVEKGGESPVPLRYAVELQETLSHIEARAREYAAAISS